MAWLDRFRIGLFIHRLHEQVSCIALFAFLRGWMRKRRHSARVFPFRLEIVLHIVPFEFERLFRMRCLLTNGSCLDTERSAN